MTCGVCPDIYPWLSELKPIPLSPEISHIIQGAAFYFTECYLKNLDPKTYF